MMTHPMFTRPRAVALATILAIGLGPTGLLPAVGLAHAAPARKAAATVTMNFVNADIEGVARALSAVIDRQIMVDPRVKGTVTLYSEQPLTPREAYLNFLSALRGQGFALVEVSGLLKVVPEADAKLQTGTVEVGNDSKRSGDQILTQIFKLQFESANSLVTVLRPLISPNNTINANPSTNTLVITDYADNLKRIGQIIAAMDVPSSSDMEAIPLQYAIAADLAPMVQRLSDGGSTPGGVAAQASLIMPESRTNALLVRAANPARLAMIKTLVQKLDRPGANGLGGSGINVVYLKNADAVKLAQVLRAAFPSSAGSGASSGGGSSSPASVTPSASTTNAASNSGASAQATAPVSASAGPSTGGFIQADPATNSLIITAPDALYRQLRAVIDQLDGRRAQVYIESMIVEVDAVKFAEVGVQWQGILGKEGDRNLVGIGTNLGTNKTPSLLTAAINPSGTTLGSGLNIGVVHDFGNGQYGLAALANFLQTKADGNVLSTPNLVVLDNEEAKIVSGENVPFPTGQYTNSSSNNVNPFTTVERKDVGLTLRVKPQIGENGTIRMTVFQENSSVKSNSTSDPNGPTTSKSAIETSVVVDDGTLLVLGGLIKDQTSINQTKVPLLGDAPLVGHLFRSENRERSKKNLMVFLRPVVMRTQEASTALTLDRYDYMRKEQSAITPPNNILFPVNGSVELPSLKLAPPLPTPDVAHPLDDPKAPAPTIVMPPQSGYAPRLTPVPEPTAPQATPLPAAKAAP
nr:type II secretion system secretin GspD [Aquabacterium sp.]